MCAINMSCLDEELTAASPQSGVLARSVTSRLVQKSSKENGILGGDLET